MKNCPKCGARVPDNATVCIECKTEFNVSQASGKQERASATIAVPEQSQVESAYFPTDYPQQPQNAAPESTGKAVVSLVLGIIGLFIGIFAFAIPFVPAFYGIILCLIGIVLAVKARNRIPVGVSGRGLATAGLTLSVVGLILSLIQSLIFVCAVLGLAALCSYSGSAYLDYTILFSSII